MTHTETINGKEVIFETVQVAERVEHSTEYFMNGYTGNQHTHTAIGSFAIGGDDFEEISYIEEEEDVEPDGYECMNCGNIQGKSNGFGCYKCASPLRDWYS